MTKMARSAFVLKNEFVEICIVQKMFTVADVARLLKLDYGAVYKIDHVVLLRLIQELKIPDPINNAIEEKSCKKSQVHKDTDCLKRFIQDVYIKRNTKILLNIILTEVEIYQFMTRCLKLLYAPTRRHKEFYVINTGPGK